MKVQFVFFGGIMKILSVLAVSFLISCGGGGSSTAASSSSSSGSSSELSLLPGSVSSFQPLDIDD